MGKNGATSAVNDGRGAPPFGHPSCHPTTGGLSDMAGGSAPILSATG